MFLVAVDLPDGVVQIQERDPVGIRPATDQARRPLGEPGQQPGVDRIQLLDMPVGERPQEAAIGRWCPDAVEQLVHATMPQPVQVVDAVRAGQHPCHDTDRLRHRVRRLHRQLLTQQLVQTSRFRQPECRDQAGIPDQVRIIEHRLDPMRYSHYEVPLLDRHE